MAKLLKKKSGFTLIELMIVVAILGILAALAVPAFITYVKRSKTGEVGINLKNAFNAASTHYNKELSPQGTAVGAFSTKCVVASTTQFLPSDTPTANKQKFPESFATAGSFGEMGFLISDPVYYMYGITSSGGDCGNTANDPGVYTFSAIGDIDGDGVTSTFEMAVGSSPENELYRGVGFYVVNELE